MAFPLEVIPSAIGAIGSLFNNEEGQRQERFQRYLGMLRRMRQQDIERTTKRTSGLVANARQAARARAAAAGRVGDAEAYILPAEQGAIHEGSLALDRTIQPYNQQELSAEQDFANRPIQPGFGDFLSEAGSAVGGYLQNKRYLDILGKYGGVTQPETGGVRGGIYGSVLDNMGADENTIDQETNPLSYPHISSRRRLLSDYYARSY